MTARKTTQLSAKIVKPIAFAIASAAVGLAVLDASPARAAQAIFDIDVNVTSGPLTGNLFEGFLSFDDSIESGTLSGEAGEFEIAFDFLGETYTEEDDISFGGGFGFPTLTVANGSPILVDWIVDFGNDAFGPPPNFSNDFAFCGTAFGICNDNIGSFVYQIGEVPDNVEQGVGQITYTKRNQQPPASVPEPGAVAALSLFGLGSLLKRAIASSPSRE
jgi:hypothetical protein